MLKVTALRTNYQLVNCLCGDIFEYLQSNMYLVKAMCNKIREILIYTVMNSLFSLINVVKYYLVVIDIAVSVT